MVLTKHVVLRYYLGKNGKGGNALNPLRKKILALGCAVLLAVLFTGCQALIEYVDNYVPPTIPEGTDPRPEETTVPGETQPEETFPQTVVAGVVTADVLNVRAGTGTEYDVVGTLEEGTKVAIYEQKQVGDILWGRIKIGWVSMKYIEIVDNVEVRVTATHSVIATVMVEDLNIRKGPSSRYAKVGNLTTGDKVQITEIRVIDDTLWGLSMKGWVHMGYVTIDGTPDGSLYLTATVDTRELTIRSEPGAASSALGSYAQGDRIVITQLQEKDGAPWGKTDKGWVFMDYVVPDGNIIVSCE